LPAIASGTVVVRKAAAIKLRAFFIMFVFINSLKIFLSLKTNQKAKTISKKHHRP
jgi:hypothetical protein